MQAYDVSFGIADLGVKTHTGRQRGSRDQYFAAGRRYPVESSIEGRRGIEVERNTGGRRLAPGADTSADRWFLVRKHG
jgi:hypothetical protein